MRIVFIGASKFGLRCLERISAISDNEIVGIVTNSEVFSISYNPKGVKNVLYADFLTFAEKQKIPVFILKDSMTDPQLIETIKGWTPDFILVVGWYHMIPNVIRNIAPVAGLHASLLPDYSGGAPLVWAIINGEPKTGITFFMFDNGIDSGDIIAQKAERICLNDTIATLYARIEEHGLSLLEENLPKVAEREVVLTPQDNTRRRIMPQRNPDDGEIDWNWSSLQIYNFIRAQTKPYPGAFTYLNGKKLTIWEAKFYDFIGLKGKPSQVLELIDNETLKGFVVATKDNDIPLLITNVGTKEIDFMEAIDYAKKENIAKGTTLCRSNPSKSYIPSGENCSMK